MLTLFSFVLLLNFIYSLGCNYYRSSDFHPLIPLRGVSNFSESKYFLFTWLQNDTEMLFKVGICRDSEVREYFSTHPWIYYFQQINVSLDILTIEKWKNKLLEKYPLISSCDTVNREVSDAWIDTITVGKSNSIQVPGHYITISMSSKGDGSLDNIILTWKDIAFISWWIVQDQHVFFSRSRPLFDLHPENVLYSKDENGRLYFFLNTYRTTMTDSDWNNNSFYFNRSIQHQKIWFEKYSSLMNDNNIPYWATTIFNTAFDPNFHGSLEDEERNCTFKKEENDWESDVFNRKIYLWCFIYDFSRTMGEFHEMEDILDIFHPPNNLEYFYRHQQFEIQVHNVLKNEKIKLNAIEEEIAVVFKRTKATNETIIRVKEEFKEIEERIARVRDKNEEIKTVSIIRATILSISIISALLVWYGYLRQL